MGTWNRSALRGGELVALALMTTIGASVGCDRPSRPAAPAASAVHDFATRPGALTFPISGRVVSLDLDARQITLAHDDIPNFMRAMTMPFTVKEAWVLTVAKPGSLVTATLVVDGARTWIERVVVADPGAQVLPFDEASGPRP